MFIARRFSCQCAKDKKIASGLSQKMANQLEQMSLEVVTENDIYHETRENQCSSCYFAQFQNYHKQSLDFVVFTTKKRGI